MSENDNVIEALDRFGHDAPMENEHDPQHGGGNGGGGSNIGERMARVEAKLDHVDTQLSDIKQDVREIKTEMRDLRQDLNSGLNKIIMFNTTIVLASMAFIGAIIAYIR